MGRYAASLLHTLCSRLHGEERGMALIEVVVSSALVVTLAVGLLTGFDVAGNTSGTNKARAVAASIAQDDQERMRGLEVRTLMLNPPTTRTVKAGAVTYTVESSAELVTDSVDEGCTTGSGGIDYLKIHSEVTWPGMRIDPVVADSLMAPRPGSFGPDEGGLSIQIVDRNGDPKPGVGVALSGAGSYNDTTDDNGCAFFTYIPVGDYNVGFSQVGQVTPAGVTNVVDPVSVPEGAVSNKVYQYDQAARLTANITTRLLGVDLVDRSTQLVVAHSGIPAPGARFFTSAPASSISTGWTLFPFTSPYTVYTGRCVNANPDRFGQTTAPGLTLATVGPGGDGTVTVREPALDLVVRWDAPDPDGSGPQPNPPAVAATGAAVTFSDLICAGPAITDTITANGRVAFPGLPYGRYNICSWYDPPGSTTPRRVRLTNIANTNPNGSAAQTITFVPGSPAGNTCP
jgi:hypothetical protein